MKLVTYWENLPGQCTPWQIETFLSILSARLADRFLLLTPYNVTEFIGDRHVKNEWRFGPDENPEASVQARSDFIRFAYIYEHGGFWVDADVLCVGDPRLVLDLLEESDAVVWDSEAFFGSRSPGVECFRTACANMLEREHQIWGDPGEIKSCIHSMQTQPIPSHLNWPKSDYGYWWDKTAILLNEDIEPSDFLSDGQALLHVFSSQSKLKLVDIQGSSLFAKLLKKALEPISEDLYTLHASRVRRLIDGA